MFPHSNYCNFCEAVTQVNSTVCSSCKKPLEASVIEDSHVGVLLGGRYRILALVGVGGFGAVYRVADIEADNRILAVKEIRLAELQPHQKIEATDTFNREVMLLSDLDYSHLPRLYDHFTDPDHWYLVMDFIEGKTLGEYLNEKEGGSFHLEEILDIGIQICTVLDYLHNHQPPIIFRDVKPANIMRTHQGQLFLIDFGTARYFKFGQAKDTIAFGSPGYAAPEQYGKAQTTPRSDIYSLGAMLYLLLTGNDPADGSFNFAFPLIYESGAYRDLVTLISQMVEIDANKRPVNVRSVQEELQRIALMLHSSMGKSIQRSHRKRPFFPLLARRVSPSTKTSSPSTQKQVSSFAKSSSAPVHPRSSRRKFLIGMVGLTALSAMIGGGIYSGIEMSNHMNIVRSPVASPHLASYVYHGHSKPVYAITWSPDGMRIASASENQSVQVWRAVQKGDIMFTTSITTWGSQSVTWPAVAWSPDGKRIAFGDNDVVQIRDANTGTLITSYTAAAKHTSVAIRTVAWSPNGTFIAFPANDGVQIWNTLTQKYSLTCRSRSPYTEIPSLKWSPDGRSIAFGTSNATVQIWNAVTGKRLFTYGHQNAVNSVAWSPNGEYIASGSADKTVQIHSAKSGELLYVYTGHVGTVNSVAWSSDGASIASGSSDNEYNLQVWSWSPTEEAVPYYLIGSPGGGVNAVIWSPNSSSFSSANEDGTVKIWWLQS